MTDHLGPAVAGRRVLITGVAGPVGMALAARLGRGEFAEIALRTGAAIVPTAVVGGEESYPRLGAVPGVGRALGSLSLPRRLPNPLAAVPLPARSRIDFGAPLAPSGHAAGAAVDRIAVLELSDAVRDTLQQAVYDTLVKREGAF